MMAYVQISAGHWSVARVDDDVADLEWWCGKHEWVSPKSSHWALFPDCWNETFSSLARARSFARAKGWEQ